MSGNQGALNKLSHLDILGALHDAATWLKNRFSSLPSWTQVFLSKGGDQELTILKSAIPVAVKDVTEGGFTTAAFVKAGKDVLAQLIAQNISTFTLQDVMANLNMAVSADPDAQAALAGVKAVVAAVDPNSPFALPVEAPAVTSTVVVPEAAAVPVAPEVAPEAPVVPAVPADGLPSNVAGHAATPME